MSDPITDIIVMTEKKVRNAALAIEATAKKSIQQAPRGGLRKNRLGEMRSAPGEPPATEYGNLANSIQSEKINDGYVVWVGAKYGYYLENGTLRMSPRPFWKKAIEAGEKELK